MKTLLSEAEISAGVSQLAEEIQATYGERPLTIIGIMTGSLVLLADLIRRLHLPLRVGVLQTSSYRDGVERGELRFNSDLMPDIRERDVLLIDDIFDTGNTLKEVLERLAEYSPLSVRSAVLLCKRDRCEVAVQPDFSVFEIPNEFVVGYGLDYRDQYRHLPYIAALETDDIQSTPA